MQFRNSLDEQHVTVEAYTGECGVGGLDVVEVNCARNAMQCKSSQEAAACSKGFLYRGQCHDRCPEFTLQVGSACSDLLDLRGNPFSQIA